MSYVRHDAIIVTASYGEDGRHWIDIAHEKAVEMFDSTYVRVTLPTPGDLNNVRTFLVAPDGSSEGWSESDAGDAARQEFLEWLRAQSYGINEDGEYEGSPLTWVAVVYGDEEHRPAWVVVDSSENGSAGVPTIL